jgi:hypothetical protein
MRVEMLAIVAFVSAAILAPAGAVELRPTVGKIAALAERLSPARTPANASWIKKTDACEYKSCSSASDCCPAYPRCDTVNGSGPTLCMLAE